MSAEDDGYKVHVSNLPFSYDHRQLEDLFIAAVGDVRRGLVIHDRDGRSKGFGFVTFNSYVGMQAAITKMHGRIIDGRDIGVTRAIPKDQMPGGGRDEPRRDRDDRMPDRYDDTRGRGGPIRDMDRAGSAGLGGGPRKHPRGFRVAVSGLPSTFTWKELKDFLRTGSRQVTYADVKRLGFGYGEWASERERQEAIHQLDGRTVDGCTVRVRAVEGDEELEGPGPGAYGGSRSMGSMGLGSGMGMGGRPMDSGYGMRGGMDSYRGGFASASDLGGVGGRYMESASRGMEVGSRDAGGMSFEERERLRLRERERERDPPLDRDRYYDGAAAGRGDAGGYPSSRQSLGQGMGSGGYTSERATLRSVAVGYGGSGMGGGSDPRADPRWERLSDLGGGGYGGSRDLRGGYGDVGLGGSLGTAGGRYMDEPRGRSDAFNDRYAPASSGRELERDRGGYGRERDGGYGGGRGLESAPVSGSRYGGSSRYAPY